MRSAQGSLARAWKAAVVGAAIGGAAVGVAACVDLFHDTTFQTRCEREPAACGDASTTGYGAGDGSTADADVTPDFCGLASAVAREQAAEVCARLGACLGPLRATRYGECMVGAQLAYDCAANPALRPRGDRARRWACLASAQTCADVEACTYGASAQTCVSVPSGLFTACGANATLVECGSSVKPTGVEPCALGGRSCAVVDPATNAGSCAGATTTSCAANGCDGTSAVECSSVSGERLDVGYDCATVGAGRCSPTGDAGAACVPGEASVACTTPEAPTCDGDVAKHCVEGKLVTIDCSKLGLACGASPRAYGAWDIASMCRARVAACTDADDACTGPTELTSCVRGKRVTIDCGTFGLKGCARQPNQLVACTPP